MYRINTVLSIPLVLWVAGVGVWLKPWAAATDLVEARPMAVCRDAACRVEVSAGRQAQFPDGTPLSTIRTALEARDGGPGTQRVAKLRAVRAEVEAMQGRRAPAGEISTYLAAHGVSQTQLTRPIIFHAGTPGAWRNQGGRWVPAAFLTGGGPDGKTVEIYDGWAWRLAEFGQPPVVIDAEASEPNLQQIGEAEQAQRYNEAAADLRADAWRALLLFLAVALGPVVVVAGAMVMRRKTATA
jgi:hypothetical protein